MIGLGEGTAIFAETNGTYAGQTSNSPLEMEVSQSTKVAHMTPIDLQIMAMRGIEIFEGTPGKSRPNSRTDHCADQVTLAYHLCRLPMGQHRSLIPSKMLRHSSRKLRTLLSPIKFNKSQCLIGISPCSRKCPRRRTISRYMSTY